VDDAVLRISTTRDIRGLVEKLSSYDNATAGSGNVVNEIVFEYDDVGLVSKEYQEHEGAKDGNTLYVQYNRDSTASGGEFTKGLRPTSVRYPNARLVHFTYGTSGETDDAVHRLAAIKDDNSGSPGNSLAEYDYLGLGTIVVEDFVEPDVKLNYDRGRYQPYSRSSLRSLTYVARADVVDAVRPDGIGVPGYWTTIAAIAIIPERQIRIATIRQTT
jgi:hypothetical protein